ncbi:putative quinol monooxygenase [Clostridium grantii]|uniref:Quinol monooxygenase YgiN n=1 Tax=Clostridium grantii DSM 8605 TaxID=1121316 RepID=A0A1M5X730_9CLOT|nr:putative quinol monooxygenase [Clostridium grantii]SHH95591.1 Quinol monooxygenase YgiN [Clostridium grantii DSM 8605]
MIKVVAKNFPKEDKIAEVIELCKELVDATRKEEGCIKYELFQDVNEPNVLTFIEEWVDVEALNKHMASEHFTRIIPEFGEFMLKDGDINVYTKVI